MKWGRADLEDILINESVPNDVKKREQASWNESVMQQGPGWIKYSSVASTGSVTEILPHSHHLG